MRGVPKPRNWEHKVEDERLWFAYGEGHYNEPLASLVFWSKKYMGESTAKKYFNQNRIVWWYLYEGTLWTREKITATERVFKKLPRITGK